MKTPHECPQACCIAAYLERKAGIVQRPPRDNTFGKPLSPMERLTLATIAWTGSAPPAARLLGHTRNTVHSRVIRSMDKLGATTVTNAIWLGWAQIRGLYDEIECSAGSSLAARVGKATADTTADSGRSNEP